MTISLFCILFIFVSTLFQMLPIVFKTRGVQDFPLENNVLHFFTCCKVWDLFVWGKTSLRVREEGDICDKT